IAVAVTILGRRLIGDGAAPRRVADSDAAGDTEPASPDVEPGQGPTRSKTAILLAALPLAIIAICGSAVEDIANNWAGLAAVRLAGVPAASAGIAFSIVIGSQCLGRFSGDMLVLRFGAGRIARIGGGLIALGGLGAVFAEEPVLLLFAMAALGVGSATLVAGALSAAAQLPGGRAGDEGWGPPSRPDWGRTDRGRRPWCRVRRRARAAADRDGRNRIRFGDLGARSPGRGRTASRDRPCRGSDARELADAGRVPRHQSAGRAHRRRGGTALGPEPARDGRPADSGVRAPARPAPPRGELIEAGTVGRPGSETKNVPRHRVNDDVGHHMVGLAGFEPTT